ncbi:hypothetical protein [Paenibacillus terrae]|uniref:Uncharacterized protein n=1 Tax=Paenibacillus terrae TaxID=159743 RepID=A0A0D7X432_9BACL|nr:hypothetical protein [Paenibacillus terrae]KJD45994.1 hypothetical protein QD47_08400 [Paenibacillus terrae]
MAPETNLIKTGIINGKRHTASIAHMGNDVYIALIVSEDPGPRGGYGRVSRTFDNELDAIAGILEAWTELEDKLK